jgi:DNA transformation protein
VGIGSLLNLGPRSQEWLTAVGITTYEDLERLGSVQAYLRVQERFPAASATLLYALEGALLDVRWDLLPLDVRQRLRREAGC